MEDLLKSKKGVSRTEISAGIVDDAQRAQERTWELVAENTRDIAWLMDMSFRTTWVTPSATRLRGYTLAEFAEMTLAEQLEPESLARAMALMAKHLVPEKLEDPGLDINVSALLGFRCKDRETFWADTVITLLRDDEGRPTGMLGVARDVSERRRVEEELQESRRRMATLLGNLPGMAYRCRNDRDWTMEFVSEGCRYLTGYSPEDLVGNRRVAYAHVIHPNDRERVWKEVQRAVAQNRAFTIEYRILPVDGRRCWVRERGLAVQDPVGAEEALEGFIAEITPLVDAEGALRESERRYREMFRRLPIQTYTWRLVDGEFVLEDANEATRVATSGGIDEEFGRAASDFYSDLPEVVAEMHRCVRSGEVIKVERDYQYRTTGKVCRLVMTHSFIPPDLVMVHADDVTQQRQTEDQLRVSQKMEAIGQLAGGVAHDFNNLLTVINSYARFVIEELPVGDPIRADVAEIERAGDRATALTGQLLAFGRRQVRRPELLSINHVVDGLESMLSRLIGEDIELRIRLADDLRAVEADPGQVEQVIMNIAVNARDAMPRGGKLTIETSNVELDRAYAARRVSVSPGSYVLLAMTDSGHGMDARTRDRIFEPFYTTKEKGRGTGLGMSTVYGIVKQSNGNIWVYSEPGLGTTFKVYLPSLEGPTVRRRRPAIAERPTGGETVLVVEDEDAVRRVTRRILEDAGYVVLTAASGDEALLLMEEHAGDIHLLVTDVVMPQMSGKQLADRLGQSHPGLKVLFMSGYSDEAVVHHGVLARDARFIAKPFSFAALTRAVREILDAAVDGAP